MCGRYPLHAPFAVIAALLRGHASPEVEAWFQPRFNVAPGQDALVMTPDRELIVAHWGLDVARGPETPGAPRRFTINARAERVRTAPAWRAPLRDGRCVVPTSGFYEWEGEAQARRPLWFRPAAGEVTLLAGLLRETDEGPAFVILTTPANDVVAPVHDRMPALLSARDPDEASIWIGDSVDAAVALLRPAAADAFVVRRVSPLLNSVANDAPELLVEGEDVVASKGQLSLFAGVRRGRGSM